MIKSRFTERQVVSTLKQVEGGQNVEDVCREHGSLIPTGYNRKSKYGGMEISDIKRLKELGRENCRLKQMRCSII